MTATLAPTDTRTAAIWGDLFEVGVKRGCLSYLAKAALLPSGSTSAWRDMHVEQLHRYLYENLDVIDPAERARHSSTLNHLLLEGWGLGWTAMREAVRRLGGGELRTLGLACPLHLPGLRTHNQPPIGRMELVRDFWTAFGLAGIPDERWADKGEPVNADFFLWLTDGSRHHLLAVEFSANTPATAADYTESLPNLFELLGHARRLEGRGVFTRIGAALTHEHFTFSNRIISHLSAFTTQDKPLYKLCQASSYVTRFLELMARRGTPVLNATAHAIAITNNGVEAIRAEGNAVEHPRLKLMNALGAAYRDAEKPDEDNPTALNDEIRIVRSQLVQALPKAFRDPVADALHDSDPASGLELHLGEQLDDVINPATPVPAARLLAGVDESEHVRRLLAMENPRAELAAMTVADDEVTLRDLHAAAIRQAIATAQRGRITVIGAEGSPGIGKTTATETALKQLDKFLWLYASPRLVINGDLTQRMARLDDGSTSGILTLTTNARLISGAGPWWQHAHPGDRRKVQAAVAADGVPELMDLPGSTVLVSRQQSAEIEGRFSATSMQKYTVDEDTDRLNREQLPGVLETLARATQAVLTRNPHQRRIVVTAAIQGFRHLLQADARRSARDTVERLSELFRTRASEPGGDKERRKFAENISTIVVMVDEIAGDGAGGPFVHALARWLYQEFIDPFDGQDQCPFKVILVLADASLANAEVIKTYLEHEQDAPEKVLVSASHGARPFRVEAGNVRLGGYSLPVLHVMADGFPARSVRVDYHAYLTRIDRDQSLEGQAVTVRKAIREQESERIKRRAVEAIFTALDSVPEKEQVIFFAQDKLLLRAVLTGLLNPESWSNEYLGEVVTHGVTLRPQDAAILDASIPTTERMELIQPATRDRKRVFLMTSSGSRGVSFPLATTIIAMVPNFAIESGFMEIAQLVYRGRGWTKDLETGADMNGDGFDRRLVLIMQDFLLSDEVVDERQWLRRTLDVVSALVLLRATLLTRMTGDAGIPGQRAAVVPVGRVGTEEVNTSLSQSVGVFIRECELFLYKNPDAEQGLVRNAQSGVINYFQSFGRIGRLTNGQQSITQERVLRALTERVTAQLTPLFDPADFPTLPEQVFALGPVWLESWANVPSEEGFAFRAQTHAQQTELDLLRRQLRQIGGAWSSLPLPLTLAARDLLKILDRPESLRTRSFRAERQSEETKRWVCVPVDYTTFCFVENEHGREPRAPQPDEHALWRDGLLRVLSASATPTTVEPIIPLYADVPFVAITSSGDPTGLGRAFDGRYFMASTELNLLNTILFVDGSSAM